MKDYAGADARDANEDARSERSALLGPSGSDASAATVKKRDGHATLTSSMSNLANTIIGSGARHNVLWLVELY